MFKKNILRTFPPDWDNILSQYSHSCLLKLSTQLWSAMEVSLMTFQKQSEGETSSHKDLWTVREIPKMEEKDGSYSDWGLMGMIYVQWENS